MKHGFYGFIILTISYILLDVMLYYRLRHWYGKKPYWSKIQLLFWASILIIAGGIAYTSVRFGAPPISPPWYGNVFVGFAFALMLCKMIYSLLILIDSAAGLPFEFYLKFNHKESKYPAYSPTRRKFVQTSGVVLAGLPFTSFLYGITIGKYNYQVKHIKLPLANLPSAFHGFKIAQLSDIHSGSFDSKSDVLRGIDMVNELQPDLITFTGDLVNSRTIEVEPYMDIFSRLSSPNGVMSIKGNHDYGMYYRWLNQEDKIKDQLLMDQYHKELGFDLMKNENRVLTKGNESIAMVGVENWGLPPFPQVGDVDLALKGVEHIPTKILLSHDPSHWDAQVLKHPTHFDLTLSGHTHGMQFGVDLSWIKWSPVKYKYPRWAGLYQEANQYLYVNRGFGFIGFPGRVGIMPEITLIELQQAGV
ncbi:MAG: metallophosphoesterase [Flavobacteriales bacterium]|nr:metallophosphoesterase [Flavobacteriales bacterium]